MEFHPVIIADPYTTAKKSDRIFLCPGSCMGLYAEHVVRRFVAGKLLANSIPDLIALAERDAAGVRVWKQGYYQKHTTALKQTYAEVVRKLRSDKRWADHASTKYVIDTMKKLLDEALRSLDALKEKLNQDTFRELGSLFRGIHDEFWDPEMFADGQTKADYARKDVDDFLDAVSAMLRPIDEFWRRLEEKWFNNLSITLLGLVDENQETKPIYFNFLKEVAEGDVEKGLHELVSSLKELPEQSGKGKASIGASLSALGNEAKKAGDHWTVDFVRTLTDMTSRRRQMSLKQREVFEKKLDQYGVPRPNYDKFW